MPEPLPMLPRDTRGRPLHDLRISVTDRCNFRCVYCMPRAVFGRDHAFLPRAELLTFDEIARLVAIFTRLGVEKVQALDCSESDKDAILQGNARRLLKL